MNGCVLVTGGAGYIGSHVAWALLDAGWRVVVVDNLTTGRRDLVPRGAAFVFGDIGDATVVGDVLREHGCSAVMHFAGSVVVPESVADPLKYYANNTGNSRTLLQACLAAGIDQFIFSSSAAVYGLPEGGAMVDEDSPTRPINPYGWSKLMTEVMLRDTAAASALRYVALRYFNVAGADPQGRTGQATPDATHLIKVACETALDLRPSITVFGDDFPTIDGTGVRDFIHVADLAAAHVAALAHLASGGGSLTLNCGYGHGFSVSQVLRTVVQVSGRPLAVLKGPRRAGDPPALIADSGRLRRTLGWRPRHDDLADIVASALAWERKRLSRGLDA